jgi:hypothetical protein
MSNQGTPAAQASNLGDPNDNQDAKSSDADDLEQFTANGLPHWPNIFSHLGEAMTQSVANAIYAARTQSITPDKDSEPKANPPTEFDGTQRRKLETYIAECEILFATSPRKYRSDSSRILAAGSYLKGDPKKWFSNFFLLPVDQRPAWFTSWKLFTAELRRCWGLEDPAGAAEAELRRINMADKDHVSYFAAKFNSIKYRLPEWSDRNFRNVFLAALAPRIRAQFVSAG